MRRIAFMMPMQILYQYHTSIPNASQLGKNILSIMFSSPVPAQPLSEPRSKTHANLQSCLPASKGTRIGNFS